MFLPGDRVYRVQICRLRQRAVCPVRSSFGQCRFAIVASNCNGQKLAIGTHACVLRPPGGLVMSGGAARTLFVFVLQPAYWPAFHSQPLGLRRLIDAQQGRVWLLALKSKQGCNFLAFFGVKGPAVERTSEEGCLCLFKLLQAE